MENRYDGLLREHDTDITACVPGTEYLRRKVAQVYTAHIIRGARAIDLGCGNGKGAVELLQASNKEGALTLLDASGKALVACRSAIIECYRSVSKYDGAFQHKDNRGQLEEIYKAVPLVCSDALTYLRKPKQYYYTVLSSWMIHNLPPEERHDLLRAIFEVLCPGGWFIWMDKIYPDDPTQASALHAAQLARYATLPEEVRGAIVAHENEDFTPDFRLKEEVTLAALKKAGFSRVQVVDRVERDLIVVARV